MPTVTACGARLCDDSKLHMGPQELRRAFQYLREDRFMKQKSPWAGARILHEQHDHGCKHTIKDKIFQLPEQAKSVVIRAEVLELPGITAVFTSSWWSHNLVSLCNCLSQDFRFLLKPLSIIYYILHSKYSWKVYLHDKMRCPHQPHWVLMSANHRSFSSCSRQYHSSNLLALVWTLQYPIETRKCDHTLADLHASVAKIDFCSTTDTPQGTTFKSMYIQAEGFPPQLHFSLSCHV